MANRNIGRLDKLKAQAHARPREDTPVERVARALRSKAKSKQDVVPSLDHFRELAARAYERRRRAGQ